ncbi:phosphate signaling complex protein PhoU [Mycobacterium sp.]|uniref:phosphate signaling complex protein PhoU n=1 Tax=Mycobacterium sp. TaxID=1785 RepID=UPI002D479F71|nr:phosphate signaling complex protein PhoU [Mycobacterium sp.]HZA12652.1 phosphate signaling complex protein PhoU [Mycobacterium sp.]
MRTVFHQQLDALTRRLADMCGLAGTAMERATTALLEGDLELAERVISDHDKITSMTADTEATAFTLLALQAPVARDLRAIVSSIHIAADVDRMGVLAWHVARIARRSHPALALPDEVRKYFAEMGALAVQLGEDAREVLLSRDPYLAAQVRHADDAMDSLHRHLFTIVMDPEWNHGIAAAVDITLLSRFYERFADHAVEVAHHIIFCATGQYPETAGKKDNEELSHQRA